MKTPKYIEEIRKTLKYNKKLLKKLDKVSSECEEYENDYNICLGWIEALEYVLLTWVTAK
jgi:hypothetical protein